MAEHSTYKTILVSSSLMGAQQVVRLAVGILQAKIVAVLLGASGTGAFGLYASVLQLGQSIFGLGLAGSGVRRIAASTRFDENGIPSRDIRIQLGLGVGLGALAGLVMLVCRRTLSRMTFGDAGYAVDMAYIAGATALALMAMGFFSALQGLRRIRDLSVAHVVGAIFSAVSAVTLIYVFRERGIAPSFMAASGCVWLVGGFFFRRIRHTAVRLRPRETLRTVAELVRLGVGFMSTGLFAAISAYAVRAMLVGREGLEIAGLYQAAWMLSTFYGMMVLQAMKSDFYPRISAASADPARFNRQVNEQVEVSLLLLVPGLLFCIAAAALVLRLLYTEAFLLAVPAARWMIAGMMIRAVGSPLAYVPLALNRPRVTIGTEGFFAVVLIVLSYEGIRLGGLYGAGVALFGTSFVYTTTLVLTARALTDFRWSRGVLQKAAWLYPAGFLVFGLFVWDGASWMQPLGWLLTLGVGFICLIKLLRIFFSP